MRFWDFPFKLHTLTACLFVSMVPMAMAGTDTSSTTNTKQELTDLSLEELGGLKVATAALHDQSLQEAPASVTVITADDIQKYGYRTLAEALTYVRGFYTTWNGTYTSIGVRGFAVPGDYNTRLLVLINGHPMTDNIDDGATGWAQDFPVDMRLVQRIEIVRGPSSAIYGTNGVLATINVITRQPSQFGAPEVNAEAGSLGEKKIQAAGAVALPKGANLLVSASVFNNHGLENLYFPELNTAANNYGHAIDVDGEKGFKAFADLTWKEWELLAVMGDRVKTQPISWGETVFNDPGTRVEDSRGFLELSYTHQFDTDRALRWQLSYDDYRYRGIYHYQLDDGAEDSRERDYGDWLSSRLSYRMPALGPGALTVGAEVRIDLRDRQNAFDVYPVRTTFLDLEHRDRNAGIFLQQEWNLGKHWKLDLGGRLDTSHYRSNFFSPRGALIYQPTSSDTIKFLYGRAFRNPSSYELFFDDGGLSEKANPALKAETADTFELIYEKTWKHNWRATTSLYRYDMRDVIAGVYLPGDVLQYQNIERVKAAGVEAELSGKLFSEVEIAASVNLQRAVSRQSWPLPNSPGQTGKLRASVPLFRRHVFFSPGIIYMGQRQTLLPASVPRVVLPEATLYSGRLLRSISLTAGVRNLFNHSYRDPVDLGSIVDTMPRARRTFFVSLTWKSEN